MVVDIYPIAKIFIVSFLLSYQLPCLSQPYIDILNIKGQKFRSSAYQNDSQQKQKINEMEGNLFIPLVMKKNDAIVTGGRFDIYDISNNRLTGSIYSILLQVGYISNPVNGNWNALFMLLPKIASSSNNKIFHNDMQLGGVVLITYKKTDRLKYKAGIYYNREFFGNFFIPLIGIDYRISNKVNLFGVMPSNLALEVKLSNKIYSGFSYSSITSSYRAVFENQKTYIRNGDRFWGHNQFKYFFIYSLYKKVTVFSEAGLTYGRKFELYNSNHRKIQNELYTKSYDGPFINAGLAYRVRL
jgi:hypothetical protein